MRMIDLFSGIGGFSLAASWVWGDELEIHSFVEIDPFCQKILRKHWPDAPGDGIQNTLSAVSGKTKADRGTNHGLRLQPAFVEYLMGYPEGYTELID